MTEQELQEKLLSSLDKSVKESIKELAGEEVANKVAEQVAKMKLQDHFLDRKGLTVNDKKAFHGMAKHVMGLTKANEAMIPEVGPRGGFLLPVEVASEISRLAADVGIFLAHGTRMPLGDGEVSVPYYTGGVIEGDYVGEDTSNAATAVTLKNALLSPKTWQINIPVSKKLLGLENSEDIANWLMALFAEGLAYKIDKMALVGTAPFVGITQKDEVSAFVLATGKNTFAEYDVITDSSVAIGTLPSSAAVGGAFIFHPTVWASLRTQKDGNGNFLLNGYGQLLSNDPTMAGPRPAGEILGVPVFTSTALPSLAAGGSQASTAFGVYGKLKAVMIGMKRDMEMEEFRSGSFGGKEVATANQVGLVASNDHAVVVAQTDALLKITTAAS